MSGASSSVQETAHVMEAIRACAQDDQPLDKTAALRILTDESLDLEQLVAAAELPRRRHFSNLVQVHILNNVKNGHCPEDCSYCAQRRTGADLEAAYTSKQESEILEEARVAFESGAHRYCMVLSGRGPSQKSTEQLASLVKKIKASYPIKLCLSAGIVKDPAMASVLAEAGLDRYNHNLNTSEDFYGDICQTHDYQDRWNTLSVMRTAGIDVCSGVIAGMGEKPEDLVEVAFGLSSIKVASIPVNFFLPVPGHAVARPTELTPEYCLRILVLFRLVNPTSEIRMAAGREIHLKDLQATALRVSNSLFVNGYLNVKGSNASETMRLIYQNGFAVDPADSEFVPDWDAIQTASAPAAGVELKGLSDLRPFA